MVLTTPLQHRINQQVQLIYALATLCNFLHHHQQLDDDDDALFVEWGEASQIKQADSNADPPPRPNMFPQVPTMQL